MAQRRIALDPTTSDGHEFRYSVEGWGLIQLLLAVSATTASRRRAAAWANDAAATDFKTITQIGAAWRSGAQRRR